MLGREGHGGLKLLPPSGWWGPERDPTSPGLVSAMQRDAGNLEAFAPVLEAGVCPRLQDWRRWGPEATCRESVTHIKGLTSERTHMSPCQEKALAFGTCRVHRAWTMRYYYPTSQVRTSLAVPPPLPSPTAPSAPQLTLRGLPTADMSGGRAE